MRWPWRKRVQQVDNGAQKYVHDLISETCKCSLFGKVAHVDVINLRILRWRNHPGLSRWAQSAIMSILTKDTEEDETTTQRTPWGRPDHHTENAMWRQSEWREAAIKKDCLEPPETRRSKNRFFLEPYCAKTLISEFWSPELWENEFLLF